MLVLLVSLGVKTWPHQPTQHVLVYLTLQKQFLNNTAGVFLGHLSLSGFSVSAVVVSL